MLIVIITREFPLINQCPFLLLPFRCLTQQQRDQSKVEQAATKMRQLQSRLWTHVSRSGAQQLHNGRFTSHLHDPKSGR